MWGHSLLSVRPLQVPVFHGYSATGNVSGQVIYASYGRKEDFDYLVSKGVDFEGKIALGERDSVAYIDVRGHAR